MATIHTSMGAGDVFYARLNTDSTPIHLNYWRRYAEVAEKQYAGLTSPLARNDNISWGQAVYNMGLAEMAKEKALLSKFGITKFPPLNAWNDYIILINKVLGIGKNFEQLLSHINKLATGKNRAASPAASFRTYLDNSIREMIIQGIEANIPGLAEGNTQSILNYMRSRKTEIIMKAFESTASATRTNNADDELRVWSDALDLIKMSKTYLDQMASTIWQTYRLDESANAISKLIQNKATRKTDFKAATAHSVTSERVERIKAGTPGEYFAAALDGKINMDVLIDLTGGAVKVNTGSQALHKNISSTDTIAIYDFSLSYNIDKALEELQNDFSGTTKQQIRNNLGNFTNALKDMKNLFVIYNSNKLYSLGDGFSGFHGTTENNNLLINAPTFITQAGGTADETSVYKVFNSISGAMYEGDGVQEEMKTALTASIAFLLFDDWGSNLSQVKSLGGSAVNSIHLFDLSHMKVPLSYMLMNIGKAFQNASTQMQTNAKQFASVSLQLPSITFPSSCGASTKEGTLQAWEQQSADVRAQAKFSFKFLLNFKQLISSMMG